MTVTDFIAKLNVVSGSKMIYLCYCSQPLYSYKKNKKLAKLARSTQRWEGRGSFAQSEYKETVHIFEKK